MASRGRVVVALLVSQVTSGRAADGSDTECLAWCPTVGDQASFIGGQCHANANRAKCDFLHGAEPFCSLVVFTDKRTSILM